MGEEDYFRYTQGINLEVLRLYGRSYIIDYVISRVKQEMEERRFRAYVTDALMILTENTSRRDGGRHLTKRWVEKYTPKETRTADEIAVDVILNAGLKIQGR